MARRRTLEKQYYNSKSKRRRTRNMCKMKGGDFAGIHFGTLEGNIPLLPQLARGVRFLGRETVALFAKHPEMAMLKRYATAFHKDYLSELNAYSNSFTTHSFWWAEKRLFEAYYSDRLREEHSLAEKHKKAIKKGMYTVSEEMSEREDICWVKEETYQDLLQQESAEFKALGEAVKAVSNDETYSTYYLYFSNSTLPIIQKLIASESEQDVLKKYEQIKTNMVALAEAITLVLNSKGMTAIGAEFDSQCKLMWQIRDRSTKWFHKQDDAFKANENNDALLDTKLYIEEIIAVVDKGIERLRKKIARKSQTTGETDKELSDTWENMMANARVFDDKLKAQQAKASEAKDAGPRQEANDAGAQEPSIEPTSESSGGKYLDGIMRKKHTKKRQIRRKRMRPSRK